jgi:hypothetical protein
LAALAAPPADHLPRELQSIPELLDRCGRSFTALDVPGLVDGELEVRICDPLSPFPVPPAARLIAPAMNCARFSSRKSGPAEFRHHVQRVERLGSIRLATVRRRAMILRGEGRRDIQGSSCAANARTNFGVDYFDRPVGQRNKIVTFGVDFTEFTRVSTPVTVTVTAAALSACPARRSGRGPDSRSRSRIGPASA